MTLLVRSSLNVWDYYWLEDELIRLIVHFFGENANVNELDKNPLCKEQKKVLYNKNKRAVLQQTRQSHFSQSKDNKAEGKTEKWVQVFSVTAQKYTAPLWWVFLWVFFNNSAELLIRFDRGVSDRGSGFTCVSDFIPSTVRTVCRRNTV